MSIKQVLVYRRDLNMRKGKIAAQCAHAAMKVLLDRRVQLIDPRTEKELILEGVVVTPRDPDSSPSSPPLEPVKLRGIQGLVAFTTTLEMMSWLDGRFTKIVLSVPDKASLLEAYRLAREAGLPTALIQDAGATEFKGVPTHTTVAIGPALSEEIDKITGPSGAVACKLA